MAANNATAKTASFQIIEARDFGKVLANVHASRAKSADELDTLLKSACILAIETGKAKHLNKLMEVFSEDKRTRKDVVAMQQWIKSEAVVPAEKSADEIPYFKQNSEGFYELAIKKAPSIRSNLDCMVRLYQKHWQDCKVSTGGKGKSIDLVKMLLQQVKTATKAANMDSEQREKANITAVDADLELRRKMLELLEDHARHNPENFKALVEIQTYMELEGEKSGL